MDVICDIDGTVADLTHRRHWVATKPKNWKMFFQELHKDTPITPVINVINSLHDDGNMIIFCSGRSMEYYDETREWLSAHMGGWVMTRPLYMRKFRDYRADDIIKYELLQQIKADGYNPAIAFDDRKRVVDMWRANGIICAQVAPGDF